MAGKAKAIKRAALKRRPQVKAKSKVKTKSRPKVTAKPRAKAKANGRAARPAPPPRYHTLTPYLNVKDAARAIEFFKEAFGATERTRMPGPGGVIMHAELEIGNSV